MSPLSDASPLAPIWDLSALYTGLSDPHIAKDQRDLEKREPIAKL